MGLSIKTHTQDELKRSRQHTGSRLTLSKIHEILTVYSEKNYKIFGEKSHRVHLSSSLKTTVKGRKTSIFERGLQNGASKLPSVFWFGIYVKFRNFKSDRFFFKIFCSNDFGFLKVTEYLLEVMLIPLFRSKNMYI